LVITLEVKGRIKGAVANLFQVVTQKDDEREGAAVRDNRQCGIHPIPGSHLLIEQQMKREEIQRILHVGVSQIHQIWRLTAYSAQKSSIFTLIDAKKFRSSL